MATQLPLPQRGADPPIFGPYQLRPNGCMDRGVTWCGARPRPRRLCVRWGPRSPSQKGGGQSSPHFSAHVYCGQTAGWMKLVLGMVVVFSPGDFVLDGDPSLLFQKGVGAPSPIFSPFLLWPNSWMHQDTTWYRGYGGRPPPRGLCVRWGPSPPRSEKEGGILGPCLLWSNGWIDQDGTWHGGRPRSSPHCAKTQLPSAKRGQSPPNFRSVFIVAKRLDASRCHLIWR